MNKLAIIQSAISLPYCTYDEINCLGQGAYGKVYEGLNTLNNETVAIKKLDLILFEKDKYLRKQIVQEIEIMSKLNHKNIVKFVELLATKKSLFIVTEMCRNGDLKSLIASKNISEQQAIDIMLQILEGFKELIKSGVIHRDMKPANVLNDMGTVKIADFGFAKYVENYSSQLLKSCVGSPLYMAPQVLERHHYSTKCDIWSLGVIFYEMLHFDVLFNQFLFPPIHYISSISLQYHGRAGMKMTSYTTSKLNPYNSKTISALFQSNFQPSLLSLKRRIELHGIKFLISPILLNYKSLFLLKIQITLSFYFNHINEESIQKLPTWIQRPSISQRQDKKVDEQKYQQIEELQSLRKQIAYQHFIMTECYTEQINNENNGELQQESIKQLLNYINENVVKESQELIQASIDLYRLPLLQQYQIILLYIFTDCIRNCNKKTCFGKCRNNQMQSIIIICRCRLMLRNCLLQTNIKGNLMINKLLKQKINCKNAKIQIQAASMLLDLINNSNWKK